MNKTISMAIILTFTLGAIASCGTDYLKPKKGSGPPPGMGRVVIELKLKPSPSATPAVSPSP